MSDTDERDERIEELEEQISELSDTIAELTADLETVTDQRDYYRSVVDDMHSIAAEALRRG